MARDLLFATALFFCMMFPRLGAASEPGSVAVVSLSPGDAESEVALNLARVGLQVVASDELSLRMAQHQVPMPDDEVASRFSSMTTTIAAGVEKFFYRGNQSAIETISPMFDLGMTYPEVLARRPDFADQVFSAGVILVRAYENLGDEGNRNAVARLLVKRFPSKRASPTTVPPKVIKLLDEQRERLVTAGSRIVLHPIVEEGTSCKTYLNGAPAEPDIEYVVNGGDDHYFWVDCGGVAGPVWKSRATAGTRLEVPIPVEDPLGYHLDPADFTKRRRAELALAAIAYWTEVDTVVGVSRAPAQSDDALVLVRLQSGGTANWSDGATKESVQRAILRVFPEFAEQVEEDAALEANAQASGSSDVLAWSLIGGGALAAGSATFLLVSASQRTRLLDCSTAAPPATRDCEGVERVEFTTEAYEQNRNAVGVRRLVGYAAVGAAVGLVSWGIVRLVTANGGSVAFVIGGTDVAVRVRF